MKWRIDSGELQKLMHLVQTLHLYYTSIQFTNFLSYYWWTLYYV